LETGVPLHRRRIVPHRRTAGFQAGIKLNCTSKKSLATSTMPAWKPAVHLIFATNRYIKSSIVGKKAE